MKGYLALVSGSVLLLAGCSTWDWRAVRSQNAEQETTTPKSSTRLVGDMASPFGTHPVRLEAVGLISGLPGTGSDPPPSPQRGALLAEMQTRGVKSPGSLLTNKTFAMVMVQGYLRPGIQKGDNFDVEIRVPGRSETTSLRGGWLLETRLKEMAVLDNEVHGGNVLALAQGPVLVDPAADARKDKDKVALCRGRILGAGVALKSRPLGLVLNANFQNVSNSARIAAAINKRFHTTERGVQNGVAKAKTDKYIELVVHPRYKDNIDRYIKVIRAVAVQERASEQAARMSSLKLQLLDPATTANAARQLEAIGRDALPVLQEGLASSDREVRFYAAEALAYLDQREAAPPLGQIARDEPAFRVFALGALSAMEDQAARDELSGMLGLPSAETRYGAFRALWAMNPAHPAVQGDRAVKDFAYYVLDQGGSPMVHVTRSRRPEVVLFGRNQSLQAPLALNAGPYIQITSPEAGQISVSKYVPGQADQKRIVSTSVDDVIRAIVDLGGTYPDVVQALEEAKTSGALASRFEVDALPSTGREFQRLADDATGAKSEDGKPAKSEARSPVPGLFSRTDGPIREEASPKEGGGDDKSADSDEKSDEKKATGKGVFAKMFNRDPQ
jgi:flagellar basal body P-ring protein FlgI